MQQQLAARPSYVPFQPKIPHDFIGIKWQEYVPRWTRIGTLQGIKKNLVSRTAG
jgi:hypothetical protein